MEVIPSESRGYRSGRTGDMWYIPRKADGERMIFLHAYGGDAAFWAWAADLSHQHMKRAQTVSWELRNYRSLRIVREWR